MPCRPRICTSSSVPPARPLAEPGPRVARLYAADVNAVGAGRGPLLPHVLDPPRGEAVRVAGRSLSYGDLASAASSLGSGLPLGETAAVWLVHGLPLFHVHGLVLGVLGSLRVGGRVRHVGRFESRAISAELAAGGTMAFAVPTMYRDLADAAEADPAVARALSSARL